MDLSLRSRRNSEAEFSEAEFHHVIDIRNFCAADPHYDMWRHNDWIMLRTPSERRV